MLLKTDPPPTRFPCRSLYSTFAPDTVLSEENRKKTIQKLTGLPPMWRQSSQNQPSRKAAVLVPLCVVDDEVALLYTLRAPNLKTHRGQVSFPGGMQDIGDKNREETALRETEEELGVNKADIDIWGRGPGVMSKNTVSVLPIIGQINNLDLNRLKLNVHEVSEVFTMPLRQLCDPSKFGHTQFRGPHCLPVFTGGQRRIWGLTALMTSVFLRALLPKDVYSHTYRTLPQVGRLKEKKQ